jgi:polyisoprenyl-phosphate glycosyltransferase
MNLSIVIPVYNSGEIISALVEKISDHIKSNNLSTEIILVNDFSKDSSWEKIKILHRKYSYVKGINLENNYGQHNAIIAGLNFCKGDFCILMDDDMQHDPKYIIDIYNKLKSGYEICYVKYLKRKHLKWKIFVSWLNNISASILALKPIKIYTSSFKGFNKRILSNIVKYKEKEVFLDWLILDQSKNIFILDVLHQERMSGKTNYNFKKLMELWSIMIIKIKAKSFFHNLWLFFPKIFIKFIVYPFVKKNNIKEQYKVLDKVF